MLGLTWAMWRVGPAVDPTCSGYAFPISPLARISSKIGISSAKCSWATDKVQHVPKFDPIYQFTNKCSVKKCVYILFGLMSLRLEGSESQWLSKQFGNSLVGVSQQCCQYSGPYARQIIFDNLSFDELKILIG